MRNDVAFLFSVNQNDNQGRVCRLSNPIMYKWPILNMINLKIDTSPAATQLIVRMVCSVPGYEFESISRKAFKN